VLIEILLPVVYRGRSTGIAARAILRRPRPARTTRRVVRALDARGARRFARRFPKAGFGDMLAAPIPEEDSYGME